MWCMSVAGWRHHGASQIPPERSFTITRVLRNVDDSLLRLRFHSVRLSPTLARNGVLRRRGERFIARRTSTIRRNPPERLDSAPALALIMRGALRLSRAHQHPNNSAHPTGPRMSLHTDYLYIAHKTLGLLLATSRLVCRPPKESPCTLRSSLVVAGTI